jgi:hypothetical protein
MKKSQKIALGVLMGLVAVLIIGWNSSTRYVEMQFLEDGVPLSGHTLEVIGGKEGMAMESFEIASDGWVKLPSAYVGKKAVCGIRSGEDLVHEFLENGFDRGETTVNFKPRGVESIHSYRFLFFESQAATTSVSETESSEQDIVPNP